VLDTVVVVLCQMILVSSLTEPGFLHDSCQYC